MSNFKYKAQKLFIEKTPILSIVRKNKTPFYCYSLSQLKDNYNSFTSVFEKTKPLVCFSVKSNSNISLLRELKKLVLGLMLFQEESC